MLPFTTIAQEAPLGDAPADPLYTLLDHADGWDALRGQLPEKAIQAGARAVLSNDDLIVIAFAGVKGNSGHSITIERITEENDRLVVTISQVQPGPDDIVEEAKTLPYHLVALSRKALHSTPPLTFIFYDPQGAILGPEVVLP